MWILAKEVRLAGGEQRLGGLRWQPFVKGFAAAADPDPLRLWQVFLRRVAAHQIRERPGEAARDLWKATQRLAPCLDVPRL
jgi:hypothetical protein